MLRYIGYLFGVIFASCYYFPFALAAVPGANSKMLMALVGVSLFIFNGIKYKSGINESLIKLGLWALGLSFVSILTCIINNTYDYSFVSYIISMCVWLGGGYCLVSYIKYLHGDVDVQKVATYLALACFVQCVLALIFNYNLELDQWSNDTFGGEAYMGVGTGNRLHGIGCALDVAGFRFSAVLIMLAFLMYVENQNHHNLKFYLYAFIFVFISVIGNMISRSTISGVTLSMISIIFLAIKDREGFGVFKKLIFLIVLIIPVIVVLFNTNESFEDKMRFGFEGFFSLSEKGEWQTTSNDLLKNMVVWPDNTKTWIIGDGYAANPTDKELASYDPYYIGPSFIGYYMNTDIGYCRFVFYFGIVGLLVFSGVIIQAALICMKHFPKYKWMFFLILILNFIGWLKVSTDLFMVFAPFICIPSKDEENVAELKISFSR